MKIIEASAVTDLTADAAEAGFRKVPFGTFAGTLVLAQCMDYAIALSSRLANHAIHGRLIFLSGTLSPATSEAVMFLSCTTPKASLRSLVISVRDFSTISEIFVPVGALRRRVARHCPRSELGMELAVAGKFQISPIFA